MIPCLSLRIFKDDLLACLIYHLWGESFIGRNKTNLLLDSSRATHLQKFGRSLVGIFFKHLLFQEKNSNRIKIANIKLQWIVSYGRDVCTLSKNEKKCSIKSVTPCDIAFLLQSYLMGKTPWVVFKRSHNIDSEKHTSAS